MFQARSRPEYYRRFSTFFFVSWWLNLIVYQPSASLIKQLTEAKGVRPFRFETFFSSVLFCSLFFPKHSTNRSRADIMKYCPRIARNLSKAFNDLIGAYQFESIWKEWQQIGKNVPNNLRRISRFTLKFSLFLASICSTISSFLSLNCFFCRMGWKFIVGNGVIVAFHLFVSRQVRKWFRRVKSLRWKMEWINLSQIRDSSSSILYNDDNYRYHE